MKKRFYISVVVASLLLSGCGSSDNDGDSNVVSEDISEVVTVVENSSEITTIIEDESKVITVERGPLLDANVTDVNGVSGVELGNGEYKFEVEPTYPITAKGGYIDIDRDGVVSEGDIKNTIEFQSASGDVVTLATTMAMDPEKKALLENLYGITPQEILNETPSTSENIEAFSNIIFQYAVENNILNISDISEDQLNILVGDFQNIREEYRNDIKTAAQHEEEIIATLDIAKLNVDEAEFIQSTFIKDINIDSLLGTDISNSDKTETTEVVSDGAETDETETTDVSLDGAETDETETTDVNLDDAETDETEITDVNSDNIETDETETTDVNSDQGSNNNTTQSSGRI